MTELSEGKPTLFISHRLSAGRYCDTVYVVDSGEIAEQGRHFEFLEKNGKYAAMYNM